MGDMGDRDINVASTMYSNRIMAFSVSKYISIPVFALSFILGLLAVYITGQGELRKVYVYPTPENLQKLQYKDSTDTCFEFQQTEVQCPANTSHITKVPIQA